MGSNVTAAWKIHKKELILLTHVFTQIHPTCIPVSGENQSKLTLMSSPCEMMVGYGFPKTLMMLKKCVLKKSSPLTLQKKIETII